MRRPGARESMLADAPAPVELNPFSDLTRELEQESQALAADVDRLRALRTRLHAGHAPADPTTLEAP